jgi:ElaB/YqjD/DUF883 family membrane-anchored ribosome-binding protein
MDEREIKTLLEELQARLRNVTAISDSDRELLRRLSADLEAVLARGSQLAAEKHQSVIDRLQESITRFEVSHPDLTNLMAQVSQKLGDMGI